MVDANHPRCSDPSFDGSPLSKGPLVRKAVKIVLDALVAALAFCMVSALLLEGNVPFNRGMGTFVAMAMVINLAFRFHTQHYRAVSIHDARLLLLGTLTLAACAMAFFLFRGHWPAQIRSEVILGASLLTGFFWLTIRLSALALHQRYHTRKNRAKAAAPERTIIIGAGRAGSLLCQELQEHPRLRCNVVGFVDDDLDKQGVRVAGVPVLGPTLLLPTLIRENRATQVILGMPGVKGSRLRELTQVVLAEGVRLKTVPGIMDLVGDRPWKPEVRDVAIEDLLRREPITLDKAAIREALDQEVVLITGAGGSIGSELTRRVAELHPGRLVLLGRGENSLWEVQRSLAKQFSTVQVEIALCDIRNPARLNQVFQKWRPKIVLHAAAHKHVPFLEEHPEEAIENNILGTFNVVEAAKACQTKIFVNVSTDKAVNPVNILGVSKAIGELIVARAARELPERKFVSVRFGNVLGSRGSVIPLFREQIRAGGPVTVTHPDMVRFFMTIPEAAQLVLQAGFLGDSGKVYALDMGEPVHIIDLASEMVRLSGFSLGVDLELRFTGVRPGEKLVEELFIEGKVRRTSVHPKVFEADDMAVELEDLAQGLQELRDLLGRTGDVYPAMIRCFRSIVPSYQPSPNGLSRVLSPTSDRVAPAGDSNRPAQADPTVSRAPVPLQIPVNVGIPHP
jgi:FlaA1/EpsC-like NDP-sugar epimerase